MQLAGQGLVQLEQGEGARVERQIQALQKSRGWALHAA